MTAPAHTPAPWFVGAQNDGLVILDGPPSPAPYDGPIPKAHGPNVIATPNFRLPEHEANTALIARAPDLLAQLKVAKRHLDDMAAFIGKANRGEFSGCYSFEGMEEDMPAIRAAIGGGA